MGGCSTVFAYLFTRHADGSVIMIAIGAGVGNLIGFLAFHLSNRTLGKICSYKREAIYAFNFILLAIVLLAGYDYVSQKKVFLITTFLSY